MLGILPPPTEARWQVRYGLAIVFVLVALGFKLTLTLWYNNDPVTGGVFVIFSSAVVLSALYGGFGPGMLATVLAAVIGDFLFLPPYGLLALLSGTNTLHTALFILDGVLVSLLSGNLRAAQRRLTLEVSARTAAEQQAILQRDQLQVTLASIGDAVIVTDAQGCITFLNGIAETLTGWTLHEVRGRGIDQVFVIINEQTRTPVESPVEQVLRKGNIVGLANHTLLIARDGTERPIADSGAPIRQNNAIYGVVLVFRDVTAQRAAEIELEQSERNYRMLIEQASEAIWVLDPAGRFTLINTAGCALLGYTHAELIDKTLFDMVPSELANAQPLTFSSAQPGKTLTGLRRLQRKDGSQIMVEGSGHRLADGRFQAIVRDITARQQVEEERSQLLAQESAARAIAEAAQQHLLLLTQISDALVSSLDYDTTLPALVRLLVPRLADWAIVDLMEAGEQVRRVAHYAADPAIGEVLERLEQQYPPDLTQPYPSMQVLRTGEPLLIVSSADDTLVDSAHDEEHLRLLRMLGAGSFLIVPLIARERVLGVLSLVAQRQRRVFDENDLTFAQELAGRIAQAIDNAQLYRETQTALHERDQFLSIAAHELRTPLTALTASAQLLQRRATRSTTSLDPRDLQAVQRVTSQAQRLNGLIESLLNLSRIELGQLPVDRRLLDLVDFTRRVTEEFELTTERHQIKLILPTTPLNVLGDDARLEQVLQNVLQNAVKYSPEGGLITVTVAQQGDQVAVGIQDSGIGIPTKAQAQLFQRFYRAGNVSIQRISGFGIGLYVVKQIMNHHNGSITVISEEGKGSIFTLLLPLADGQEARTEN